MQPSVVRRRHLKRDWPSSCLKGCNRLTLAHRPRTPICLAQSMEGGMPEYRGVAYEVRGAPDGWRWTIYPKKEVAPKETSPSPYDSKEEAAAACRAEIDRGFDAYRT